MLELLGAKGYILARLGPGVWLKAAKKMGSTGLALPANIPYGAPPHPLPSNIAYARRSTMASALTNELTRGRFVLRAWLLAIDWPFCRSQKSTITSMR
jgi:hypothetical protein